MVKHELLRYMNSLKYSLCHLKKVRGDCFPGPPGSYASVYGLLVTEML